MATDDEFKAAVTLFVELHDEMQRMSKEMKELRQRKDALGETILKSMRTKDIDVCQLGDGRGRLVRKETKTTGSLKKEHICSALQSALGDERRAEAVLNTIYSQRNVEVKETLARLAK